MTENERRLLLISKQLSILDAKFLMGKYTEKKYKEKREALRMKATKVIKDNNLIERLKLKKRDYSNIIR